MRTRVTMMSRRQRGLRQPVHRATWTPMPPMARRRTLATPQKASTRRCAAADLQLLCSSSMQHPLSTCIQAYAALQFARTPQPAATACGHWQMWFLRLLQEIRRDAFWLQRRVTSAFGSLDAAEAQQLAEKIFRTLEVKLCILHVPAHHPHSSVRRALRPELHSKPRPLMLQHLSGCTVSARQHVYNMGETC